MVAQNSEQDSVKVRAGCCTLFTDEPLTESEVTHLAETLSLLAHPIRLRILAILARHAGHVCVCDLEATLPVKQPTVSHHLRLLRDGGLIEGERRGQWIYYAIHREALDRVRAMIHTFFDQLGEA